MSVVGGGAALWRGERSVWLALVHSAKVAGSFAYLFLTIGSSFRKVLMPSDRGVDPGDCADAVACGARLLTDCRFEIGDAGVQLSNEGRTQLVRDELRGQWRGIGSESAGLELDR